jgi:hypothetical protein
MKIIFSVENMILAGLRIQPQQENSCEEKEGGVCKGLQISWRRK